MNARLHPDCLACGNSGIVGSPPDQYMNCPDCNLDPDQHPDDIRDDRPIFNIADTCCGRCPGASCYVDQITGERP